jgi:hypothetical protein
MRQEAAISEYTYRKKSEPSRDRPHDKVQEQGYHSAGKCEQQ